MLLKDFITDYRRAVATEIYNAQMNSVEDAVSFLDKMETEAAQFFSTISMCESLFDNIHRSKSAIAHNQERLKKLNKLKNSHIGQLIAKFAANNTDEGLEEIKKELERSNEFDIHIVPKWKKGDGERMYGIPHDECFVIVSTQTNYLFDKFDIDEDIQRATASIGYDEEELRRDMKARNWLRDKCGVEVFDFMVEQFEKNDMIMPDAPCNYIEDYDDDYYDDEDY